MLRNESQASVSRPTRSQLRGGLGGPFKRRYSCRPWTEIPLSVKPTETVARPLALVNVNVLIPAVFPAVTVKVTDAPAELGVWEVGLTDATEPLLTVALMADAPAS